MVFVLFCWFFVVLVSTLQIFSLKAYFGIEISFASKCKSSFFLHFPSAILVATTWNSSSYIISLKYLFHVTQPSLLPIEPFSFYMASHVRRAKEWTLGANASFIQHLSTRWREILNSHQFEHWYCQWQCLRQSFVDLFTLNAFKEVEQDQNRVHCINYKFK